VPTFQVFRVTNEVAKIQMDVPQGFTPTQQVWNDGLYMCFLKLINLQLVDRLAENLECLNSLNPSEIQEAMGRFQERLPSSISVQKTHEGFIIISLNMSAENPMSLRHIVNGMQGFPTIAYHKLTMSDDHLFHDYRTEFPDFSDYESDYLHGDLVSTPINCVDTIPEQLSWDSFDSLEWPSWIDSEFP
jgi:hypothetical protein